MKRAKASAPTRPDDDEDDDEIALDELAEDGAATVPRSGGGPWARKAARREIANEVRRAQLADYLKQLRRLQQMRVEVYSFARSAYSDADGAEEALFNEGETLRVALDEETERVNEVLEGYGSVAAPTGTGDDERTSTAAILVEGQSWSLSRAARHAYGRNIDIADGAERKRVQRAVGKRRRKT